MTPCRTCTTTPPPVSPGATPGGDLSESQPILAGIQRELDTEVGPHHPLWGLQPTAFGKCDATDDVLVALVDGRFACIHLVWHGKVDQLPEHFPATQVLDDIAAVQALIDAEGDEHTLPDTGRW